MVSKKNKKNRHERQIVQSKSRLDIHETTRNTIFGIGLIIGALILVLSYFEKAGVGGYYLFSALDFIFGSGFFVLIILLLVMAVVFFVSKRPKLQAAVLFGGLLFLLSILGGIDVFMPGERAGGIVGLLVAYPFVEFFSVWAAMVILFGVALVALALIFNISIAKLFRKDKEIEKNMSLQVPEKPSVPEILAQAPLPAVEAPMVPKKAREVAEKPLLDVASLTKSRKVKTYGLPPLDLLEKSSGRPTTGDIKTYANIIKRTLENFGIPVEMGEINVGPTVTQYTLKPAEGVKLSKITALSADLGLALAVHPIRIEAPIPGRSLVGIEVPNRAVSVVKLRDLLELDAFQNATSLLSIPLGRDVAGAPSYVDLSRMPHLLIAGATGSGKSVAIHSILISFLYRNYPNTLRFIIIDPKRVELSMYEDIPHLLSPVVVESAQAINALKWAVKEMDRRYQVLAKERCRDIIGYNNQLIKAGKSEELMPFLVVVVDELADLMLSNQREVETSIVRLAQMARSVGIHLVISTQRPSVEVITGLIKANITSRIAFQVASQVDSRTILDTAGAEKLLGNGDMLFLSADSPKPKRIQGCFVSDKEVKKVVDYLQKVSWESGDEEASVTFNEPTISFSDSGKLGSSDDLFEDAKKLVIDTQKASASFLQRRLQVGYARAARLLDLLEEAGVIGPGEGAKPRQVFVRQDGVNQQSEDEVI
ncbi:DNA translocase FtsK [Candidatus Parcubacteria bacterium]|nr:MAG: DNA translocase FtsK [Candidatus Parcubacteria bacterium]